MENKAGIGTWVVTATSAAVGAVAVKAAAPTAVGLLASFGIGLAPVALTVGALGGGKLGWDFMRNRSRRRDVEAAAV